MLIVFGEVMLPLIAKRRAFSVSVSGAVLLMIIMLNYVKLVYAE